MEKLKVDKDYRVTLPSQIFREFKPDEFVKIFIKKDENTEEYYVRVPKIPPSRKYLQVRRRLPDYVIQELQLKQTDFVEFIKIEKLENQKGELVKDSYIDLLGLALPGIMADKFTKDNEEWVRFWQSNKVGGITNQIELKRFIPIDRKLGEFFGLMQAESGKKGNKFDFTNTIIETHKLFVDVSEQYFGISRNSWSFGLICNPNLSLGEIENIGTTFSKELSLRTKYYHTRSKTILKVAYVVHIDRRLLNLIMNALLLKIRKEMIKSDNLNLIEFSKGFIIKDLLGDGTVSVSKSLKNMEIVLSEKDTESQDDIVSILNRFGINSNINGIRVDISTDFDSVIWFLENELFVNHVNNRKKFLRYVNNNFYIRTLLSRISTLGEWCSIHKFSQKHNLSYNTSEMYLHRNTKRGFLQRSRKQDIGTVYKISDKGKAFLETMKKSNP